VRAVKKVTVLSTGNELLYGTTLDTNSSFISGALFTLDLHVGMHLVVGDDLDDLERALRHALDLSDIIIMTGGLGPTDDDNTIEALRRIFGFSLHIDGPSRERMASFLRNMGLPMSEADQKMAEVPDGVIVIPNNNGLAPGFIVRQNNKIVIALPGVPREMTDMMARSVIPFLQKECRIAARAGMSYRLIGMKESDINESIKSMPLPLEQMDWGMTAKDGVTTVTFVPRGGGELDAGSILAEARKRFGNRFLDPPFKLPEEEAVNLLRDKRLTVSFAESCTGGLISKRITDIPGASDVFTGAVVAYDNRVKVRSLGVSEERLSSHGAVSAEVASDMAEGVRKSMGSDIGISTTGIAGPGGGTEAKPVGTVWFALADSLGVKTFTMRISGDRERVRMFASLIAIEFLRNYLREYKS
jgi:nicotinamide-nucleotide amidase